MTLECTEPALMVEPLFRFGSTTAVDLGGDGTDSAVSDFLSYAVVREPQNLKRHVQRVAWHLRGRNVDALYAALVDLFVVLGANGLQLRARLLERAEALLMPTQAKRLQRHLHHPLLPQAAAAAVGSVLARPIMGDLGFVRKVDASNVSAGAGQSLLDEARVLLEEGQVDAAQKLLELALRQHPEDMAIRDELRGIYRATSNERALRAIDMPARVSA